MTAELKQNSRIIAEFVGFTPSIVRNKGVKYDYNVLPNFELIKEVETTIESVTCEILQEQDYCMVEDLKFHTSWDWLMPVVEKVREVCHSNSNAHYWWNNAPVSDIRIFRESLIDTFQAVITFINWYNQQSK